MERKIVLKLKQHIDNFPGTQKDFAQKVGLREATVSQLVNNKYDRIQLTHILTLMDAIGTKDFNDIFEIKSVD
ncbi:helix-turn-helix domain-containing protein [Thalassobacillus hwangdonensis]|uniref:Helix-turn-helix domain-containing protein n=1 Tax=Thalassobacillus hwangdonensis TaxID=546108 RepID=A0ABW3L000_9BACI